MATLDTLVVGGGELVGYMRYAALQKRFDLALAQIRSATEAATDPELGAELQNKKGCRLEHIESVKLATRNNADPVKQAINKANAAINNLVPEVGYYVDDKRKIS